MVDFAAIARTVGHLSKSADVMKLVNNLMKAPEVAITMQEFSKEMMKVCFQHFLKPKDQKFIYVRDDGIFTALKFIKTLLLFRCALFINNIFLFTIFSYVPSEFVKLIVKTRIYGYICAWEFNITTNISLHKHNIENSSPKFLINNLGLA